MPQEGGVVAPEVEEQEVPLGPNPAQYQQNQQQAQQQEPQQGQEEGYVEQDQPFDENDPRNVQATQVQPRYVQQPQMVNEVITSKVVVPRPANIYQKPYNQQQQQPAYRYVPRVQFKENEKTKTHREILDEIMLKPESIDWRLAVHRYLPLDHEGVLVPRGRLLETSIMPFDGLREEIVKTWGGGQYRVIILNERKEAISGIQAILIDVPLEQCAPKIHKGEVTEAEQSAMNRTNALVPTQNLSAIDEETREADKHVKATLLESRMMEAELKKTRAKIAQQVEFQQLLKLQRSMFDEEPKNGAAAKQSDDAIAQLREDMRKQMEQARLDREALEKKYEEALRQKDLEARDKEIEHMKEAREKELAQMKESREREMAAIKADRDREMSALREEIKSLATKNSKSEKDEQVEELKTMLKEQKATYEKKIEDILNKMESAQRPDPGKDMREMMTAIIPAITKKDDSSALHLAEVMKAGQDNMRQSMEMFAKMNSKDTSSQTQLVNSLIQTVMTMKQGENSPDLFLKLVKFGKESAREQLEIAQLINGGSGGGDEPKEPAGEFGWDPKAGFLGNVGKLAYAGFKGLVQAAQQNPQLYEVLFKLIGNRNPSETEMAAAAHRMEMQQANMLAGQNPALMNPQQQLPMRPQQQVMPPQMRQGQPMIMPPATPMIQTQQQRMPMTPQQQQLMMQQQQQRQRQMQQGGMPPSVIKQRPAQVPLVTPPPATGSGTAPAVRPPAPPTSRPAPAAPAPGQVVPVAGTVTNSDTPPVVIPEQPVSAPATASQAEMKPVEGTTVEAASGVMPGASSELVSAMLGVDLAPESTSEEIEPRQQEVSPVPVQTQPEAPPIMQAPDQTEAPDEDEVASKEDRLRYYVTESMKIAVDDISDKRNEHIWMGDAHSFWGADFLHQIAALPEDGARYNLIASKCDPKVWEKLMSSLSKDDTGKGYEKLFEGIRSLVQMANEPE